MCGFSERGCLQQLSTAIAMSSPSPQLPDPPLVAPGSPGSRLLQDALQSANKKFNVPLMSNRMPGLDTGGAVTPNFPWPSSLNSSLGSPGANSPDVDVNSSGTLSPHVSNAQASFGALG